MGTKVSDAGPARLFEVELEEETLLGAAGERPAGAVVWSGEDRAGARDGLGRAGAGEEALGAGAALRGVTLGEAGATLRGVTAGAAGVLTEGPSSGWPTSVGSTAPWREKVRVVAGSPLAAGAVARVLRPAVRAVGVA